MDQQTHSIIHELLHDNSLTFDSLVSRFNNDPDLISNFKKALAEDEQSDNHELIVQYIQIQSQYNKKEIFDEVCNIYRKPFLTHQRTLSRVVIINQETFLQILQNDKRFFKKGPEKTSVDVIEEQLLSYLCAFYPYCFSKEKRLRKKELYDALFILEEKTNPPLITTTRLSPGTGSGMRRRKRYCLTDEGFNEILHIVSLVLRDQLDNLQNEI